jgi:DNA-binding HxlR family transcriptional regulator
VARTVYPVVPPRVEYALTPLGASLLVTWTEANQHQIAASRATYDARAEIAI